VLDTTPPELVAVAAAAGFRTIGIRLTATPSVGVPPYDILSDGPLLRETLRRLADTGVSVLDTEFLRFEPEYPVGVPDGFLEVSARLGARNVLVMSAEPEETRTLERFCELCDRAAPYGLHVGLEFAVYTGVRTLAHAAHVVARSKRSNASVLVDALHFSRSGGLPAHIAQVDQAGHRVRRRWVHPDPAVPVGNHSWVYALGKQLAITLVCNLQAFHELCVVDAYPCKISKSGQHQVGIRIKGS